MDMGSSGDKTFVIAFVGSVAIISWQEIHDFQRVPIPSRFIGAGVAFGILAVAEPVIGKLASTLAWGLLLALLYEQNQHKATKQAPPPGVQPIPVGKTGAAPTGGTSGNGSTQAPPTLNGIQA